MEPWAGQRALRSHDLKSGWGGGGPCGLSSGSFPFQPLPDLGHRCVPLVTHEFTHKTTMFFHRFRVPTTFTIQTFLGLRESSFSSSAEKENPSSLSKTLDRQPQRQPHFLNSGIKERELFL